MNLTSPTNSLQSNIMANGNGNTIPAVGMGATKLMYTDRHAGTIVAVRTNKKGKVVAFTWREDNATRTDSNGMSDSQSYAYSEDVSASPYEVTLRANGRWVKVGESAKNGTAFGIGYREKFHDYSF